MAETKYIELGYDTANILAAIGSKTGRHCVLTIGSFGIETLTLTTMNVGMQCRIWMQPGSSIRLPSGTDLSSYGGIKLGGEILGNVAILRVDLLNDMGKATEQVAAMMNLIDTILNFNARGEKPKEPLVLRLEFQKERLAIDRETMRAAVDLVLRSDAADRIRQKRSYIRVRGFVPNR